MAKNTGYDSAFSADHEKVYINLLKINFYDWNFLVRNGGEKISLKLENRIG